MQRLSMTCESLGPLKPGSRPLEGKSFYLDEVKSRSVSALTGIIVRLGGKVESFLHNEVSMVITANRDALADTLPASGKLDAHRSRDGVINERPDKPRPPVCGSRGRALLEKAIQNKEKSQAGVLTSARSWGVKIVVLDDFLKFVHRLTSDASSLKNKRNEKMSNSSGLNVIKAGSLKASYVKVEDSSRKYRPVYAQSLSFPMLSYTRRFSPFETPTPVQACKILEEDLSKDKLRKSEEPINSHDKPPESPSPKIVRKKKSLGYCECCQINYTDQDEHLQSEIHQRFVQDVGNYAVVDRLVASMTSVFTDRMEPRDDVEMISSSCSTGAQHLTENQLEIHQTNFMGADFCFEPWENAAAVKDVDDERVSSSPAEPREPGEPCVDAPVQTPDEVKRVDDVRVATSCSETGAEPEPDVSRESNAVEVCAGSGQVPPRETSFETSDKVVYTYLKKDHDELPSAPSLVDASSCSALSRLSILPLNFSIDLNPRKRSRSFRFSPRVSKMRRTCVMSDPINVHTPLICSESLRCTQTNKSEPKMTDPDLLKVNTVFAHVQEEQKSSNDRGSSELGPPELYPFYLDDDCRGPPYPDPPKLVLCAPLPSPKISHPCTSSASLLSQSFSSVCIESALIPDAIFSTASSESDWDSGLLSRLAPVAVQLRPGTGQCELDLGVLLQSSCAGVQDGSYASRLCSVLQHGDVRSSSNIYRNMEALERRIVSGLGV